MSHQTWQQACSRKHHLWPVLLKVQFILSKINYKWTTKDMLTIKQLFYLLQSWLDGRWHCGTVLGMSDAVAPARLGCGCRPTLRLWKLWKWVIDLRKFGAQDQVASSDNPEIDSDQRVPVIHDTCIHHQRPKYCTTTVCACSSLPETLVYIIIYIHQLIQDLSRLDSSTGTG